MKHINTLRQQNKPSVTCYIQFQMLCCGRRIVSPAVTDHVSSDVARPNLALYYPAAYRQRTAEMYIHCMCHWVFLHDTRTYISSQAATCVAYTHGATESPKTHTALH